MKKIALFIIMCISALTSVDAAEPREISYAELAQQIKSASTPVVVDCYATWCGPCRVFAPVFDKVAAANDGKAEFFRVDIDGSPEVMRLGVRAVPTVLVFYVSDGKLSVETQEGALDEADFSRFISEALKKADGSHL